jgi:hypothetical protein
VTLFIHVPDQCTLSFGGESAPTEYSDGSPFKLMVQKAGDCFVLGTDYTASYKSSQIHALRGFIYVQVGLWEPKNRKLSLSQLFNYKLKRDAYSESLEGPSRSCLCECRSQNGRNPQGSQLIIAAPLPDTLFIQLTRNTCGVKNTVPVLVEERLTPEAHWFADATHADGTYQLTRLVIHKGASANNGHYFVYCLDKEVWWVKDDLKGQVDSGNYFTGSGVKRTPEGWLQSALVQANCSLLVYEKLPQLQDQSVPIIAAQLCCATTRGMPGSLAEDLGAASRCFQDPELRSLLQSGPGEPGAAGVEGRVGPIAGASEICCLCASYVSLPKSVGNFQAYYRVVTRLLGFEFGTSPGLPLLCWSCWAAKTPFQQEKVNHEPSPATVATSS